MGRNPLYREIAVTIIEDISDGKIPQFFSINDLTKRYAMAKGTIHRALQVVKLTGLIDIGRGHKIKIVLPEHHTHSISEPTHYTNMTSSEKLALMIQQFIAEGIYKRGTALPKTAYFRITYHLSSHTVTSALANLCSRNIGQLD